MLRYTRNTVIAFDFEDALSFEGETGPYAQYAVVRAANIFRKGGHYTRTALRHSIHRCRPHTLPAKKETASGSYGSASRNCTLVERCIQRTEPAYLAKYAFQLAQQFSNFYHRHHILTESDPARKALLLATAAIAQRELTPRPRLVGHRSPRCDVTL